MRRHRASGRWRRPDFRRNGESGLAARGCQDIDTAKFAIAARRGTRECRAAAPRNATAQAFAQTLAKLHFVELIENLRRILFNYGQKRLDPANATFNAAC